MPTHQTIDPAVPPPPTRGTRRPKAPRRRGGRLPAVIAAATLLLLALITTRSRSVSHATPPTPLTTAIATTIGSSWPTGPRAEDPTTTLTVSTTSGTESSLGFRVWLPHGWTLHISGNTAIYAPSDATLGAAVTIDVSEVDPTKPADRAIADSYQQWLAGRDEPIQVGIEHTTLNGYATTNLWLLTTNPDLSVTSHALHFVDSGSRLYLIDFATEGGADTDAISNANQLIDTFTIETPHA